MTARTYSTNIAIQNYSNIRPNPAENILIMEGSGVVGDRGGEDGAACGCSCFLGTPGNGVGATSPLRHVEHWVESTAGTALVMGRVWTAVVSCTLGRRLHRAGVNKVFVRLFLVLALHVVFLFVWPS